MFGPLCLTIRPSCLFFQGGPVLGRPCLTISPSCLFFSGRTSVGTSMFNYQTFMFVFFMEDQCWDLHV